MHISSLLNTRSILGTAICNDTLAVINVKWTINKGNLLFEGDWRAAATSGEIICRRYIIQRSTGGDNSFQSREDCFTMLGRYLSTLDIMRTYSAAY